MKHQFYDQDVYCVYVCMHALMHSSKGEEQGSDSWQKYTYVFLSAVYVYSSVLSCNHAESNEIHEANINATFPSCFLIFFVIVCGLSGALFIGSCCTLFLCNFSVGAQLEN